MPIIRVEMLEGRTKEQKSELVSTFTEEMVRITGCPVDSVYIVIEEVSKDNWGLKGKLISESN